MKIYIILFLFFLTGLSGLAQSRVEGIVKEVNAQKEEQPLSGVSVYWLGTSAGTETDTTGNFSLPFDSLSHKLVLNYIGYQKDTIPIEKPGVYTFFLKEAGKELETVVVEGRKKATEIDLNSPFNVKWMNEKELFKAACCNLSESFETNPSVDVNYADAVSGAKQIQMLGLSGIYTQISTENLPGTRGLSSNFGLSYIPGTWIESIQVTKGIGSVVNGYESIAGQINVELKKPEESEKVYLNGYLNSMGRTEGNMNLSTKVSKRLTTAILTHVDFWKNKIDLNNDGFLDMPLSNQYSLVNRWKYKSKKGFESQAGVKILSDDRVGGQVDFSPQRDKLTANLYGIGIRAQRYEGFAKMGYIWQDKPYKSIGLVADVLQHTTTNYFGLTSYQGLQQSLYGNLIYQTILKTTDHKIRSGVSFLYDHYNEQINSTGFKRTESVPGIFGEYTFSHTQRFTLVTGLRLDYNSLFGWILTPRVHGKYSLTENTTLRIAGGRGQRTANIFAENMSYLASARQWIIHSSANGKAYGLTPEIAWNYGINLVHEFKWMKRNGTFSVDYYRTDFVSQVVADLDRNPQTVVFGDLDGQSYSNSVQAELMYEPVKRFEWRIAYRFYDVKTTYHGTLLERYLISKHRAFVNISYETKNKWSFDYTISWNGPKRIPNTSSNPPAYRKTSYSGDYILMNAQVSKKLGKWFEVYLGAENLTNFRQADLIIAPEAPFGPYFDTSLVWGPIIGRMYYAGFRMKIK